MQVTSVHCCLPFFVQSIQEAIVFVPVASAMTPIHRDHLVVASNARWLEIVFDVLGSNSFS